MNALGFVLVGVCLFAASGLPGLFMSRQSHLGERVATGMMALAGALGLLGAFLPGTDAESLRGAWGMPWGQFVVVLDPLSRVFLLPVFVVPPLGAIYGLGYWRQADHPNNGRKLRLYYGLMPAAMAVVLLARDGTLFLVAWEVMALSAFFLVSTEDDQPASRNAGWVYFVATHVGTLSLFAMFAVIRSVTGSFELDSLSVGVVPPGAATAIFVLAAMGFGLKAGLIPLHVWLPGAHANAPSHVSAVLSGVMLKMGIYGLVRMTGLLPAAPAWWGQALLVAGAVSAVLGLAFAIAQHDLKRLLAYSSIENVGIIAIGLGLALAGRSAGRPEWVVLGMGGAFFHVWNHCLFKPLLFFGAGSVTHGAGTRRIDHLGGLLRRMPRTAGLFLVGCVAICAMPPLNGFVSELLIYLGLFRTLNAGTSPWLAAAAPVLALVGGLAVVAFAKAFGIAFLGEPRSESARHAHESPRIMIGPMVVLAGICFVLGAFPTLMASRVDDALAVWRAKDAPPLPSLAGVTPLGWLPMTSLAALALGGGAFLLLRRAMNRESPERPGTWDCGYAAPAARMQYTGSSFTQVMVGLFSWALLPRVRRTRIRTNFPAPGRFRSEVPDVVLDRMVLPFARVVSHFLRWARLLQQGQIQVYVLYVLLTVLVLFVFVYLL